jgi:hypothetical protein
MAQQLINIGSTVNDGTGDTLRSGAQKINANFAELYLTTIPTQVGNGGKFLSTDGTGTQWVSIDDTIVAAANQLTGTTLAPTVTTSSLTSVGTLIDLAVTNPIVGSITGNAATASSVNWTSIAAKPAVVVGALTPNVNIGTTISPEYVDAYEININGNADTVTNGLYDNRVYNNPSWLTSLSSEKVLPSPVGNSGKFLTTNGSADASGFSWSNITSLPGGAANRILYQTGIGVTGFLPAPTSNGTFLKYNGSSFEWTATGAGQGTVTQVEGTGTVSGITLSGTVTSNGNLTLGGTLTLTSGQVTAGLGYSPLKLNDLSITTLAPAGGGSLSYNNATGIFTFTPPLPPVGTVNDFIFTDGNGFDGTVTLATSTPTLSLAMTVTGLLKGSGTGFVSAVAGTDYIAPYTSTTANLIFASPNATAGVPTFRQLVSTDIPILNQNTTGSAARLTVPRNINGQAFDGTADINITVPIATGVTGLVANATTFLTAGTSLALSAMLTDETGSGSVVFSSSPTIANPVVTTSLLTTSTSFDLLPSNALTINFAGETTTLNLATAGLTSGSTKTVNLGTGAVSGATTNINIGSASGGTITANTNTVVAGNIEMTGIGRTFSADFTNVTIASRAYFKSNVANGQTSLIAVPNGSSTSSRIGVVNNSSPTNSSRIMLSTNASTDVQLVSDVFGTGTYLPITMWTNGASQVKLDTTGDFTVIGAGGLGYGTGSGGAIAQGTSRTTGVTINKTNGAITLFSTTTTAGTFTSFTVTNSTVAATDTVQVNMKSGSVDSYIITVSAVAAGTFRVQIYNVAAVAVAEAPVINFAVIKAVTA